jgi:hypothetical protein
MIDTTFPAVSKVIVYDCSPLHEARIKQFCESHNLIAVKPQGKGILDVLKSYVDLGAIFLSEDLENCVGGGIALGKEIHRIRPELPIILRSNSTAEKLAKNINANKFICATYNIDDIESLVQTIDEHIFCTHYPNSLVRGIEEITRSTLHHFFDDVEIEVATPYVVKDRIIFGELFSLIPVESSWCKGYMMLQIEEANVRDMVKLEKISGPDNDLDNFRIINDVLSEITNMTWGGIRNRFVVEEPANNEISTQVPIIVNHKNKYITFGTNTPQLCFRYTLNGSGNQKTFTLYHKFVFNLYWKPDRFSENEPSVNDLVNAGELDFFLCTTLKCMKVA